MVLSLLASSVPSFLPIPFRSYILPQKSNSEPKSSARIRRNKHQSEKDGGSLPNRDCVYLHLEQGLAKDQSKSAIISTHQPTGHLDDLIAISNVDTASHQLPNGVRSYTKNMERSSQVDTPRSGCLKLSYRQLHHIALNVAAGLFTSGAEAGSTILLLVPNSAEFGILLWMSVIMRITYVCADPAALKTSRKNELRQMMKMLKPSLIAVADAKTAESVDDIVSALHLAPPLRICTEKTESSRHWRSLNDLAFLGSGSAIDKDMILEDARNDDPQRVHSILFTSGTSGKPKGCPMRVEGMAHALKSQSWLIDGNAAPFALQQAHPSRGIAPAQTLQTWRAGGAVVMDPKGFAADDAARAIREHQITFLVFPPAMVHAMAQEMAKKHLDVDSVKRIQVGGDAITKGILTRCAALFPNAEICVNHGMTEGPGSFIWPFFGKPINSLPYFGEMCPVGSVAPGAVVRVWDPENKKLCEYNEPGEMHVCCKSIIKHYLFGRSENSYYEDEIGRWFITGDVAMMNADGLIYVLGRSKDAIKCAGTTIMPAPLESCIEEYTSQATTVVSVPHEQLGQEPVAVLASLNDKTPLEIKEHVNRTFGRRRSIGPLVTLNQIGLREFPVNATHKIVKQEVQRAVSQYLDKGFI